MNLRLRGGRGASRLEKIEVAAEVRRQSVRDFVARHREELSPRVVDAAFAAGIANLVAIGVSSYPTPMV